MVVQSSASSPGSPQAGSLSVQSLRVRPVLECSKLSIGLCVSVTQCRSLLFVFDSWNRLQWTPTAMSADGSRSRKWMNGFFFPLWALSKMDMASNEFYTFACTPCTAKSAR